MSSSPFPFLDCLGLCSNTVLYFFLSNHTICEVTAGSAGKVTTGSAGTSCKHQSRTRILMLLIRKGKCYSERSEGLIWLIVQYFFSHN